MCSCGIKVETTVHYVFYERKTSLDNIRSIPSDLTFWNNIKSIIPNILEQNGFFISNALLFGDTTLNDPSNTIILNMTVDYIMSTKRFNDSTFTF